MKAFLAVVERKVKAATIAALAASALVALLNWVVGDNELLGSLPAWLQFVLVTFGPTVATAVAGYKARHTAVPPVK